MRARRPVMGILFSLGKLLFGPRTAPASPYTPEIEFPERLRAALLRCEGLTEAEVDAYISYKYYGVVYMDVPLDYGLNHPDADILYLYADSVPVLAVLRQHTNQIEPETLEKVQRVLREVFSRRRKSCM